MKISPPDRKPAPRQPHARQKRTWNTPRGAIYRTVVRSEVKTITFRAVEPSLAMVKTIQRSGSVTETAADSGVFSWTENPSGNGYAAETGVPEGPFRAKLAARS